MLPPAAVSLDEADAAIELWEHYKRRSLDPWQRLSVQLKMATRADGRWAARTTGEEVPRQAGKGDAEEVVELWGIVQRAERILHTVHDAVLLATETHSRMLSLIDGHADLRKKKARAWSGTGQQMIEMRNGGIIWYRTRTGGGGRGVDEVDRIVVDEAQHAEAQQIEATSPTQLASENPQTNAMGTGAIEGKSAWWWSVRKRALLPNPGEFAYLGFTAERLSVIDGRVLAVRPDVSTVEQFLALVHQVHPTLKRRPDLIDFFAEEYRKLGPDGASREYLLVWDAEPDEVDATIPNWDALKDETAKPVEGHQWALCVTPDRKVATLGAAGRTADGRLLLEVIQRSHGVAEFAGVGWVLDYVRILYESKRIPLRIHKSAPEAAFIAPLRERGVEVEEISTADLAQATGQVIDAAANGSLTHLGNLSLSKAVAGAVLRTSSDGASVWSQRDSSVEISPLLACTVAAGGVPTVKRKATPWVLVD